MEKVTLEKPEWWP